MLIIPKSGSLSKKYHAAGWLFVSPLAPFAIFPSEFATLSRNQRPKCTKCRNLPCALAPRSGCPKTARGSLL